MIKKNQRENKKKEEKREREREREKRVRIKNCHQLQPSIKEENTAALSNALKSYIICKLFRLYTQGSSKRVSTPHPNTLKI